MLSGAVEIISAGIAPCIGREDLMTKRRERVLVLLR